jgi:hypothetical protein
MQRPQILKQLQVLAEMDPLDYLLCDAYSDHITVSESYNITNGYVWNSQQL